MTARGELLVGIALRDPLAPTAMPPTALAGVRFTNPLSWHPDGVNVLGTVVIS